jgi:protein-L-isoaspartate(D-aspartate) O-methyltransferase
LVQISETIGRRGLIAGGLALGSLPAFAGAPAATLAVPATPNGTPWDKAAFETAMAQSGRPVSLTDAQFAAIQARKPAAMKLIADYLTMRLGTPDPLVLAAFEALPREYYHYNYQEHRSTCGDAYDKPAKPWALGYGSALSDYLGQAYMTQVCAPKPGEVSLEIGTGSGFQSSLLSRIVDHAYSIEIIEPLGNAVKKIFAPLGYDNVTTRVGDGYYGWPEQKAGFDIIIVTCAAQYAPPALFQQLKPGGRMIIPIGQPFKQGQVLYVYRKDAAGKIHSRRDMGVFFIPMTGTMMKIPKAQATASPA